jgi:hypothetical protein
VFVGASKLDVWVGTRNVGNSYPTWRPPNHLFANITSYPDTTHNTIKAHITTPNKSLATTYTSKKVIVIIKPALVIGHAWNDAWKVAIAANDLAGAKRMLTEKLVCSRTQFIVELLLTYLIGRREEVQAEQGENARGDLGDEA